MSISSLRFRRFPAAVHQAREHSTTPSVPVNNYFSTGSPFGQHPVNSHSNSLLRQLDSVIAR